MNIPEELKYTEEHEWVRIEDNIAVVGITDFAQGELGDIILQEQHHTLHRRSPYSGDRLLYRTAIWF